MRLIHLIFIQIYQNIKLYGPKLKLEPTLLFSFQIANMDIVLPKFCMFHKTVINHFKQMNTDLID